MASIAPASPSSSASSTATPPPAATTRTVGGEVGIVAVQTLAGLAIQGVSTFGGLAEASSSGYVAGGIWLAGPGATAAAMCAIRAGMSNGYRTNCGWIELGAYSGAVGATLGGAALGAYLNRNTQDLGALAGLIVGGILGYIGGPVLGGIVADQLAKQPVPSNLSASSSPAALPPPAMPASVAPMLPAVAHGLSVNVPLLSFKF